MFDDGLTVFIFVSVMFWIIMIILDAIIAFFIPAKRVERKLLTKSVQKKLIQGYVTGSHGIYNKLRPKVRADARAIINALRNEVKSEINVEVNNIVEKIDTAVKGEIPIVIEEKIKGAMTNDIPHLIEDSIKGNAEEFQKAAADLKRMFATVMSIQSKTKRGEKAAQRLSTLQSIHEWNPQIGEVLGKAAMGGFKTEVNQILDAYMKYGGMLSGDTTQMSGMRGLSQEANQFQEVRPPSREGSQTLVPKADLTADELDILNDQYMQFFADSGQFPMEIIHEGDKVLEENIKKRKEGEKDVKTKETK